MTPAMAGSSSKRTARKRRSRRARPPAVLGNAAATRGPTARPGAGQRQRRALGLAGTLGDRPPGPFGGVPVSELAILVGIIGAVIGYLQGDRPALIVGIVICGLGVLELTAREHLSGYRSHTTLLAAFPAVALEGAIALVFGLPRVRILILVPVIPVFAIAFWLLRRRFIAARRRRAAAR